MSIISPICGTKRSYSKKRISGNSYQVYHNTYSSAISEALEYAKKKGYEYSEDDVWNRISMGNKKPSEGKTNRATITLFKDGKEQKKALQIQVYGMKKGYELNAYIN
jgi:hypothetical protein